MGRGNCLAMWGAEVLEEGLECLRCAMCCMCIIVIAGPILFIIGITTIASPNNREANVNKYNDAIKTWTAGDQVTMKASTMSANSYALQMLSESVVVSGNTDGVNPATSVDFVSYQFPTGTITAGSVTVRAGPSNISGTDMNYPSLQSTNSVSTSLTCNCKSSSRSSDCYCSYSVSDCPSGYRNSYSGSGSCRDGSTCGTCYGTRYLADVCVVVEIIGGTTFQKGSKTGCKYPFDTSSAGTYSSTSSTTVTFKVRAASDPYVQLQEITKGDMDFGLTQAQQIALGFALLAIGASFMLLTGCSISYVCCDGNRKTQFGNMYNNALGRGRMGMAQPMMPMQGAPAYPQTGYGQSPGYAQPYGAPGYGAPPPAYGAPPPAYGAPAPAYGAPAPGYAPPGGYPPPAGYHQGYGSPPPIY
jgi:hypothetical protein